jgi:hypothetical protein
MRIVFILQPFIIPELGRSKSKLKSESESLSKSKNRKIEKSAELGQEKPVPFDCDPNSDYDPDVKKAVDLQAFY